MTRLERWERNTEIPLLLLAAAFLVAYAWPVLDPRLDPDLGTFLRVASWTVWVAFAFDFAIRLYLAGSDRWPYAKRHWYDVALIALPMLRPLRLLRLLALARVINRSARRSLVGQVATYVIGVNITCGFSRRDCGVGRGAECGVCEHHHLRRRPLVGVHNSDDRRLRRPLPGH